MLNRFDAQYKNTLRNILDNGDWLETRGTRSKYLFGHTFTIDLRDGFPASTLRNVYPKSALWEMLGFDIQSRGEVSAQWLSKGLLKVWDAYTTPGTNYLPHSYSEKWRDWNGVDQLQELINKLIKNPTSRSCYLQSISPDADYSEGGMPNCGMSVVFSSNGDGYLDAQMMGRSLDAITGMPGDCVRYAALLMLVAKLSGLTPRFLQFSITNIHIYETAIEDAHHILSSEGLANLPTLNIINPSLSMTKNDYELVGYKYNKDIKLTHGLDLGDLSAYS